MVERKCPNSLEWLYYSFLYEYKARPVDLDDLLAGIRCMSARADIQELTNER